MDISALNAVYLRNVPPTPANYARRTGRAGRSGQAALIVTYCAAQSPHDQYFPHDRNAMVSGTVRAPALDLLNEQLLTSHLQAVWLAASGVALAAEIPQILDLSKPDAPLREEIAAAIQAQGLPQRARAAMRSLLSQIIDNPDTEGPAWMTDTEDFAAKVAVEAHHKFGAAFD